MRLSAVPLLALFLCSAGCGLQVATASRPQPATASPPRSSNVASLREAGRDHLKAGRLDAAIQTLESVYRLDPGDTEAGRLLCEAYNHRAVARYSDDHPKDAIADLRRSLELDPSQSEIREQLTRAEARLDRLNAIGREGQPED